jgi:hypothetical protein
MHIIDVILEKKIDKYKELGAYSIACNWLVNSRSMNKLHFHILLADVKLKGL